MFSSTNLILNHSGTGYDVLTSDQAYNLGREAGSGSAVWSFATKGGRKRKLFIHRLKPPAINCPGTGSAEPWR